MHFCSHNKELNNYFEITTALKNGYNKGKSTMQ